MWEKIEKLSEGEFRRLTGVKRPTFEAMCTLLKAAHLKKKARGGRKNKLSVEAMLLLSLEYRREYRTYFHIGQHYGVSESYAYKIIRWVEDTLIKSGLFSLPGRKALLDPDCDHETVLVDATETPVQRPKKSKRVTTQARRSATH